MHALADLGLLVREEVGGGPLVRGLPALAAVVGAEDAGRGDPDHEPLRVVAVDVDRVQAHAAGAGVPLVARLVLEQAPVRPPTSARGRRAEEHAGVAAEPELAVAAGLDVPRRVQLQLAVLRQPDPRSAPRSRRRRPSGARRRRRRSSCTRRARRPAGRGSRGRSRSPSGADPSSVHSRRSSPAQHEEPLPGPDEDGRRHDWNPIAAGRLDEVPRLTDEQRRVFLDRNYGVVATLRADGSPQLTTVWVDADEEDVLFNITETRKKYEEPRARPARVGLRPRTATTGTGG